MAETEERSLDDFFAKRDKKKRKEKSSRAGAAAASAAASAPSSSPYSSSSSSSAPSSSAHAAAASGGLVGNRPAEGGPAGTGPGSGSGGASSAAKGGPHKVREEDDWKEFEQEEIIDYSGLRVQSMQISEKDDEENEKRDEQGDNNDESGGGTDKSSGPWNRSAPTQAPVAEIIETSEPVQSGNVYRPPGARDSRTRKVPQGPPEIYSDTQFPSLQSTAKHVDSRRY